MIDHLSLLKIWVICHRQQWQKNHLPKHGTSDVLGFSKHIIALLSWVLWIGKFGEGMGGQLRNEVQCHRIFIVF